MATIHELIIADEPATWATLGFAVDGDVCRVGSVPLRFAGRDARSAADPGAGIVGWTLGGIANDQLDGLPTSRADGATPPVSARQTSAASAQAGPAVSAAHSNGVTALDHVVAMTPVLDRTVAALQEAGLDLRRIREEPTPAGAPRQAFFRLGDVILEVVQVPDDALARSGGQTGAAFFWGLAFKVADLDATVAAISAECCSGPRPAVQPGRRIAALRRSAGLAMPVALMTN
jgi:hypothetical protein